ncbi:hypothetical protein AB0I72_19205 [Nocardiopsis sp. NPDC049922]|uniref:hypothetical protein n=1 Tax=Nocardiopsis sp. NPDC049922 TaxID=3155157 RepID=UPI0033D5A552
MALGDDYATLSELKDWFRPTIVDTADDDRLTAALTAASRGVEKFCRRQFNQTATATARRYRPTSAALVMVDDFHTITDLVVETDTTGDGTFDTTWTSADYELEPLDGLQDGVEGWPFWRVRAVSDRAFPAGRRTTVRVTAQWGWAAVPDPVAEATLVTAADLFKMSDAPFGVHGSDDFGLIRVRENYRALTLLAPYRKTTTRIA